MSRLVTHLMVLSVFIEGVEIGPLSVGRIVVVLAVLTALTEILLRRCTPRAHPAALVPAGLLTLMILLSGFWATDQGAWRDAVLELALALGYFLAYITLVRSREEVRVLLRTYVLGAVAAACIGLYQIGDDVRAVGLQGDPNTYALYGLAALPIAAVLGWRAHGFDRLLWGLAAGVLLASVFGSQSRGALLGFVAVLGFLLLAGNPDQPDARRPGTTLLIGVAGLTPVLIAIVSLFPRLSPANIMEDRGTGRVDIWLAAWTEWQEHPLLGIGAGNFVARSGDLLSQTPGIQLDPYSQLFEGIRVHSAYLEALVELGPFGLAAFLGLLAGAGLLLQQDRLLHPRDLTQALLPMLVVYAVTTIFLSTVNNKLLWMLVGLAAVLPYLPDTVARQPLRRQPVERRSPLMEVS